MSSTQLLTAFACNTQYPHELGNDSGPFILKNGGQWIVVTIYQQMFGKYRYQCQCIQTDNREHSANE